MKIAAIIAEYNPFHNGHYYHIEETKKRTACDYIILVLSGDFTQRGLPSIMPKHEKAKIALSCGADLVLELPTTYATGTAERFAYGAVSLLHQLGCVDYLSFGAESSDLESMQAIASLLNAPPESYHTQLKEYLLEGMSYPKARQQVLAKLLPKNSDILSSPNNILAIEYLKALQQLNSTIQPIIIPREGASYHEKTLSKEVYPSATGLREYLENTLVQEGITVQEIFAKLSSHIPASAILLMNSTYHHTWPVFLDDFSAMLQYKVVMTDRNVAQGIQDLSMELFDKIKKEEQDFQTISDFTAKLKSKDLTYTRISRALLHLLLETPNNFPAECPYIRVLGFRKEASVILSHLKESCSLPIIIKLADAIPSLPSPAKEMLFYDIKCSLLYKTIIKQKYGTPITDEYRTVLPIL